MQPVDQPQSWISLLGALLSWSRLQQLSQQQASLLSFIVITPLVIATAVLLWRKGAMGFKAMLAVSVSCLFVAWFLASNL